VPSMVVVLLYEGEKRVQATLEGERGSARVLGPTLEEAHNQAMTRVPAMSTNTGLEMSKGLRTLRAHRLVERLALPDGLLSRTDLRRLRLERRAVDAVFRACDVVVPLGYSRPHSRGCTPTAGRYVRIHGHSQNVLHD
jgi:hypothetical protein